MTSTATRQPAPAQPGPVARDRGQRLPRRPLPVALLAAAAAICAVLVHLVLFPDHSGNADEGIYLLQAEALRQGHLTLPAGLLGDFFQPWLTGEHDGHLFTKYLPGLPALFAASLLLTGSAVPALAAVAAAWVVSVYALAAETLASRRVALAAAALTALSPILLVHSAVVLPYGASAAVLLGAAACWLRGARLHRPGLLAAAGALFGAGFLIRQYDVLLVGGVVAAYLLVRSRRMYARLLRDLVPVALGALPFLVAALAYNAVVAGGPLHFPLNAVEPLDAFGFGPRRMMPGQEPLQFTPGMALSALVVQLGAVPNWVFGGPLLLVLAVVGLLPRRRRAERLLLAGLAAAFPAGYFFFWGVPLANEGAPAGLGPHYYVPAFGAVTVLAAAGLDALLRRLSALPRRAAVPALVALAAVAVALTAPAAAHIVGVQRYVNVVVAAVRAPLTAPGAIAPPAVVLLPPGPTGRGYVGAPYPFLHNDPQLRGPVLYAASQGAHDNHLADAAPGRALYALRLRPVGDPPVPDAELVPLTAVTGEQLRVEVRVRAPADGGCLTASLQLAGRTERRTLACDVRRGGTYGTAWTLGPGGLPLPAGDAVVVAGVDAGEGRWEEQASLGMHGQRAVLLVPGAGAEDVLEVRAAPAQ